MHAIYISLGNISKEIWKRQNAQAWLLLAKVPVSKFPKTVFPGSKTEQGAMPGILGWCEDLQLPSMLHGLWQLTSTWVFWSLHWWLNYLCPQRDSWKVPLGISIWVQTGSEETWTRAFRLIQRSLLGRTWSWPKCFHKAGYPAQNPYVYLGPPRNMAQALTGRSGNGPLIYCSASPPLPMLW